MTTETSLSVPSTIHARALLGDYALCGTKPTEGQPICMTDDWPKSTCPACVQARTVTFRVGPQKKPPIAHPIEPHEDTLLTVMGFAAAHVHVPDWRTPTVHDEVVYELLTYSEKDIEVTDRLFRHQVYLDRIERKVRRVTERFLEDGILPVGLHDDSGIWFYR